MRYLTRITLLAGMALVLSSCAPISAQLDELTGTTLAERCMTRRATVAAYDAIKAAGDELTATQAEVRLGYQIYIDSVCPPLSAEE